MFDIYELIKRNEDTFYNYKTNQPIGTLRRKVAILVISAFLCVVSGRGLDAFLDGIITVQAILIGFSFSVMVVLADGSGQRLRSADTSLEDQLKTERLDKLSTELFYNLSYFNAVAMFCLAFALALLLPSNILGLASPFAASEIFNHINLGKAADIGFETCAAGVRFGLYVTVGESGYTFVRTIGRVGYLFEQKVKPAAN